MKSKWVRVLPNLHTHQIVSEEQEKKVVKFVLPALSKICMIFGDPLGPLPSSIAHAHQKPTVLLDDEPTTSHVSEFNHFSSTS